MCPLRYAALGLLFAVALACAHIDVHVNRDPSVDLTELRTWAWLPPDMQASVDQRLLDRYLDRRLRDTVSRVLWTKGYVPVAGEAPDLFLNYRLTTSDRSSPQPPYNYQVGGWWDRAEARAHDSYSVGTLVLDAIGPQTRSLIWRGTASAELLEDASLEKRARRAELVVENILQDFPARRP